MLDSANVAPRVGAWIETTKKMVSFYKSKSHPVWVRGLKHNIIVRQKQGQDVAPRVGAWIETYYLHLLLYNSIVAPRVGAWIETYILAPVCGSVPVAPRVGAWIETCNF